MVRIEARLIAPTAGLDGGKTGELSSPFALTPPSAAAIVPRVGIVVQTGPEGLPDTRCNRGAGTSFLDGTSVR
jgi:hypothetical protein